MKSPTTQIRLRPTVLAVGLTVLFWLGGCNFLTGERPAPQIERVPYAAAFMPPQVRGAALGMDWPTLKQSRPKITHGISPDVHGTFEYFWEMNDSGMVRYFFSDSTRPDTAFSRALPAGVLSSVEVTPRALPRADTGAYRRLVTSTIARWDSLAGPADSVARCWSITSDGNKGSPLEWRTWRRSDVVLLLLSTPDDDLSPDPSADTLSAGRAELQTRGVTMVVQSARLASGLATIFDAVREFGRCETAYAPVTTVPRP